MQDRIPDGYTILKLGGARADARGLQSALRDRGAPVTMIETGDAQAREIYEADLVLVRPDLHVVWRGNAAPDDPARVAAIATGH